VTRQSLLPALATTGIGSLPHLDAAEAVAEAVSVDIPYLAQLPRRSPLESMLAQALEGLPGLEVGNEGGCRVRLAAWAEGARELDERLGSDELSSLEPSTHACACWRPFLAAVTLRRPRFAKVQIAGPVTLARFVSLDGGRSLVAERPLFRQVCRLVFARGVSLVRALARAGCAPVLFLDEPGLDQSESLTDAWGALGDLIERVQREGAIVGVHCCGDAPWERLLEARPDIVSLDVRHLDALLGAPAGALSRFVAAGGRFGLGVIPTTPRQPADAATLSQRLLSSLRPPLLRSSLLSPACGLSGATLSEARGAFQLLAEVRERLGARLMAGL